MILRTLTTSSLLMAGMAAILMKPQLAMAEETRSEVPGVAARLAAGEPVTIACLGDSVTGVFYHTGGWRAYPEMIKFGLDKLYPAAKVTVINAGVNGNSTPPGLKRLQKDVLDHKPQLVTVMYGLNDMITVPIPDFQANLKQIAERCREIGAEVIFCTPNPVTVDTSARPTARLVEYCDAMKSIARELNVPVCDCYGAHDALRKRDPLAWRLLMSDFAHPNMDGHKLNAVTICKTISGRETSLDDVPPPQPAIPKTLARIKAGQPVRILAMAPYDELIGKALAKVAPAVKVEVTAWPVAGQTLAQIEEVSKTVRKRAPDLDFVIVAVPLEATPVDVPPTEATISSYTWILNWSLAFGYQEWDVIGIAPSVLKADLSSSDRIAENFARHLINAQHISQISRAAGETGAPEQLLEAWLRDQLSRK